MKRIVKGNDFTLRITVMKMVEGEKVAFPLPACTDVQVRACTSFKRTELAFEVDAENDNVILARVEGDKIAIGTYAVEVKGKIFGNDWRSEEYPQFQIVARNADADTEFGETDDGDNSVEMDSALVILPPSVELSTLISDANKTLAESKEFVATAAENEAARVKSESERETAEKLRVSSEQTRKDSEALRVDAESERVSAEETRNENESDRAKAEEGRASAELKRADSEVKRVDAESRRASSETSREDSEKERESAESIRQQNEETRTDSEKERVSAESLRSLAEDERSNEENTRKASEKNRIKAESARAKAELEREKTKEACQTATDNANTATDKANKATEAAETATEGAEKVNVELSGNSIITTDRNGVKKSVDVIDTQEQVTVTITSQVDSINVSGIKVNVFLNNGKTPQTYTTNDEGKCSFVIDRGNYYEVSVPEYANAQPLSPVGYTAVLADREIAFEYVPYDEETSEKVIVTVTKYVDKVDTAWQGKEVKVKYDAKTTTYTTDEKGQAVIYVGYKKEYTVTVDNEDGYMVYFGKNSRTYTARVPERRISVKMYQFETGIFVMDSNADSYTIEEWQEAGKTSDEAVAIKVADYNLMANNGTFMIRTSDLQNMSKLVSLQWCTQNLQFNSIALNGNNSSDANYWSGEQSTFLVMQEAEERSLSVPAFNYAYNQTFEIGDNIGDTALHGFLMSVGQEYVHIVNSGVIRDVLTALYGEDVGKAYYTFVNGKNRWTSTQVNATNAWYFNSQANYYVKYYGFYVLPVFAC